MAHPAFTFYQNRMREVYHTVVTDTKGNQLVLNAPPKGSAVAKAIQAKMAFAKSAFNHSGVHLWFPDDELGLSGYTHMQGNKDINTFVKQTNYEFNLKPTGDVLYQHNARVLYDFSVENNPLADQCTHDQVSFTGLDVTEFHHAVMNIPAHKPYYIVQEESTWHYGNAGASWHWLLPAPLAQGLGIHTPPAKTQAA
jgi:hypothetical protein